MGFAGCVSFIVVAVAVVVTVLYQSIVLNEIHFSPVDLSGKIALVTGGSSGIGLETVRKLVEWNASVIMPVRNVTKGESVRQAILSTDVSHRGSVELLEMDLASLSSVRKFASVIKKRGIHIDILILNAGMQSDSPVPKETMDGIEMVYQVNHLAHFLLTRLLLPSLSESPSRIVHVSSSLHYFGSLDRAAYSSKSLNMNPSRLAINSYSDTKLMNVVFSNTLQRKLSALPEFRSFTSVAVHPGFVLSELDRGTSVQGFLRRLRELIARPTADGAITQVTAATSPSVIQRGGGLYFEDHCIMNGCESSLLFNAVGARGIGIGEGNRGTGGLVPHESALSLEAQEWLWNTSSDIIGLGRQIEKN